MVLNILQNSKLGPKALMMPFYLFSFICMRSVDAFELPLWVLETLPGEIGHWEELQGACKVSSSLGWEQWGPRGANACIFSLRSASTAAPTTWGASITNPRGTTHSLAHVCCTRSFREYCENVRVVSTGRWHTVGAQEMTAVVNGSPFPN